MPVLVAGLLLGALSGGITYGMSLDGHLSAYAGGAAVLLTWLGCTYLAFEASRKRS
ncbi:hypothetical protein ACFYRN_25220 [Streptomyces sp. NPDC005227]|uniref:hypothetical protein n=1 Tax=Streptomyces sp. NPDC005227 TaxID=3364707 RepID=UPI0036B62A6C